MRFANSFLRRGGDASSLSKLRIAQRTGRWTAGSTGTSSKADSRSSDGHLSGERGAHMSLAARHSPE